MENSTPDFTWMFIKMLGGLGIVIALAFVLLKYVLPKTRLQKFRKHPWLEVIDRVPLSVKSSVYLVKLSGRYLTLGVSESSVNLITEISQEEGRAIEKS
ncbi:MAG: flagellar biosynthetic protein FliO [Deltaproteobacteria bacterium]|nr:MAG: flagellar biosynthetic protein FliO [Deltaproteobacteria bacterium]